jgi:DNA-binding XRE family transcriptional regulator
MLHLGVNSGAKDLGMVNSKTISDADRKYFGLLVRSFRIENCMTQQTLADKALGANGRFASISEIENGKGKHASSAAQKVCRVLGIPREQVPVSLQWPDPVSQKTLHPNIGQRLFKPTIQSSLTEDRKKAVGGKVTWRKLLDGAYMHREQHLNEAYQAFSKWKDEVVPCCSPQKLPLFWIGGRSGDGKSALLLQLVQTIFEKQGRINIFQAASGATISSVLKWFHETLPFDEKQYPTYIIVDDLHLIDNPKDIFDQVNYHDFSILACGPTPEFKSFIHKGKSIFESSLHEIAPHNTKDRAELASWLGVEAPTEKLPEDQLLVETLFEFAINDTVHEFADKFKQRLKIRGLYKAAKSALSLNLFDMLAPIDLASDEKTSLSLEHMSHQNHLHFEKGEQFGFQGFRLVHSKIAWRLFERWVTDEHEDSNTLHCLAESVAFALSYVVGDNHLLINTLISMAETRVSTFVQDSEEESVSPAALRFFTFLEQAARETGTLHAQMLRAILQYEPTATILEPKIVARAVKARDNEAVTHRVRMNLAATLVRPHNSIIAQDRENHFSALCEMLKESSFWPVATSGILALLLHSQYRTEAIDLGLKWVSDNPTSNNSRQILARLIGQDGNNPDVIDMAYQWIKDVGNIPNIASVLGALISQDRKSSEVKTIALSIIEGESPKPWHQQIICTLLRKYPQNNAITDLTKKWLDACEWQKGSESILTTLVSNGSDKDANITFALEWIKRAGQRSGLEGVFRTLIKTSEGQKTVTDEALKWVRSSNNPLNKAFVIGALLKHSGDREDVIQMTKEWLDIYGLKRGAMEVLKAYIPASRGSEDAIKRSLSWIKNNLRYRNSEQVLRTLQTNVAGRPAIIEMHQEWSRTHR